MPPTPFKPLALRAAAYVLATLVVVTAALPVLALGARIVA